MDELKDKIKKILQTGETIRVNSLMRELCDTFSVDKPKCIFTRKEDVELDIPDSNLEELRQKAESNIEIPDPIEITASDTSPTEDVVLAASVIRNSK